jgi:hypothetical protein
MDILFHLGETARADLGGCQSVLKKSVIMQWVTYNRDELIQHVWLCIQC